MSTYFTLAVILFLSLSVVLFLGAIQVFGKPLPKRVLRVSTVWLAAYGLFLFWGTGPKPSDEYPPANGSPYKLPWKAGISRYVAQGNRSFVSHRDGHLYAYDFWMASGSEILASRAGTVTKVEDLHDGIGLRSNLVKITHPDGTSASYAHIRKSGSVVRPGDKVSQGQLIAYSGMVGQTLFPHVHFVVTGADETQSIPVSFSDVTDGVPLAGRFYTSNNKQHD